MAAPKRKRDGQTDSSRAKSARRLPSTLSPGPVEQHARVLNTAESTTRHFTRGAKRNNTLAARNGVFNTEELLEAVLVELPALDLIRYQRVAKRWRDTISTSVAIKEKLFIKPKVDLENWKLEAGKVVATTDTPDLLDRTSDVSTSSEPSVVVVTSCLNPLTDASELPATNAFLSDGGLFPSIRRAFRRHESISISDRLIPAINQLLHGTEIPLLQTMILINLPVTNVEVRFGLSAGEEHTALFRFPIKKDGPLTLNDIIERAAKSDGAFVQSVGLKGSAGRRIVATGRSMPFENVMQKMKDVSGRAPQVTSAAINVYGLIVASTEDRETVRKGKNILLKSVQLVPKVRRT